MKLNCWPNCLLAKLAMWLEHFKTVLVRGVQAKPLLHKKENRKRRSSGKGTFVRCDKYVDETMKLKTGSNVVHLTYGIIGTVCRAILLCAESAYNNYA